MHWDLFFSIPNDKRERERKNVQSTWPCKTIECLHTHIHKHMHMHTRTPTVTHAHTLTPPSYSNFELAWVLVYIYTAYLHLNSMSRSAVHHASIVLLLLSARALKLGLICASHCWHWVASFLNKKTKTSKLALFLIQRIQWSDYSYVATTRSAPLKGFDHREIFTHHPAS